MIKALPCPFCGKRPKVLPTYPAIEGNAWAAVQCTNYKCPAQPRVYDGEDCADDRGSRAYKYAAIIRWNTRWLKKRDKES